MKQKAYQIENNIDFTRKQWEEIQSLSFEPFDIGEGEALTRGQWLAVAQMALGNRRPVRHGRRGRQGQRAVGVELREIADTILAKFTPGDGNL